MEIPFLSIREEIGESFDSMRFIGKIPRGGNWEPQLAPDLEIKHFIADSGYETTSGPAVITSFAERESILKYSTPDFSHPDEAVMCEAVEQVYKDFAPYLGGWKELDSEAATAELNPDSSNLFPLKGRKRDMLASEVWPVLSPMARYTPEKMIPPFFSTFSKREILEELKVQLAKTRTITGPYIFWLFFQIIWLGDWAHRLSDIGRNLWGEMPGLGVAKGWTPLKGGFLNLLAFLSGYCYTAEADQSAYDSCIPNWLRWTIYHLRIRLYGGKNPRMRFYLFLIYFFDMYTWIVTASGEVYLKMKGMCSGTFPTADDNTLMHIICVHYIKLRNQYLRGLYYMCLGDDLILASNAILALKIPYYECGLFCKVVKWFDGPEGASFLGMTYLPNKEFEFDWETLLASLMYHYHGHQSDVVLAKVCSIALLVPYQLQRFEFLRSLYWHLVSVRRWDPVPQFPDREFVLNLWTLNQG